VVCLDPIQGRCGTDALLEATCLPCPFLDVGPVPNECGVEVGNRIGKVIVPSTPIMNDLGPRDTWQASRNLGCTDKLFNIDVSTHAETIPPRADIGAIGHPGGRPACIVCDRVSCPARSGVGSQP
jgi:hypothetical protein